MSVAIRPITPDDTQRCGEILYLASEDSFNRHHFVRDYPTLEAATAYARLVIQHRSIFGVVACESGRLVGVNFLKEFNPIRGIGPLAVDPSVQSRGIGRALMEPVLQRASGAPGVRLVQVAYHLASLSLYASLGFAVREPIVWMQGKPSGALPGPDIEVRPLGPEDLKVCAELCMRVHGIDRSAELRDGGTQALVLWRAGRVAAYLSDAAFGKLGHAVAETLGDMQSLIVAAASARPDPVGFLVATRQHDLLRWCLDQGMRAVKPMTLMSMGFYQEPRGCYLPSVQY